jgi:hypothetical protein
VPELARAARARAGKEAGPRGRLAAVTVTDPRPSIAVGLSLLPTFLSFADQSRQFDVTKIPTAQAVNEWLFPGVTVLYDDGDAWRWESHFSVVSVGDLVGPTALSVPLAFVARVGF